MSVEISSVHNVVGIEFFPGVVVSAFFNGDDGADLCHKAVVIELCHGEIGTEFFHDAVVTGSVVKDSFNLNSVVAGSDDSVSIFVGNTIEVFVARPIKR